MSRSLSSISSRSRSLSGCGPQRPGCQRGVVVSICVSVGQIRFEVQFYEIRRNFQVYGTDGLLDRMPGAKGPHPNRIARLCPEIQKIDLAWSYS